MTRWRSIEDAEAVLERYRIKPWVLGCVLSIVLWAAIFAAGWGVMHMFPVR